MLHSSAPLTLNGGLFRSGNILKMHLNIYANRSGWCGDLGLEHVAIAVQRSLLDFQNAFRICKIMAIKRQIPASRTHPDGCFERAVRGPYGVVGKSGLNVT